MSYMSYETAQTTALRNGVMNRVYAWMTAGLFVTGAVASFVAGSNTLISLIFGWWGFPWGILWTPIALYHLWRGGRDCTEAFLIEAVGHADARRVLAAAPKPKAPPAIWIVRLLILVPVLAFGFLFTAIASA